MKSRAGKRQREEKDQKKEDADARKGRKVAKHCVFPMICGSGGSKSRPAKVAGAEPAGQMRNEKLHYKTHQLRTTFGSCDVEKVHAVVARSTFWSQNVQSTPGSDHFWKLRCRKSVRRCGAKHILKSKCTKHTQVRTTFGGSDVEKVHAVVARSRFRSQNVQNTKMFEPLLEVRTLKKCTPLWREADFEVKMCKTPYVRATFGGSDVAKSVRRCGAKHISKSKCTKHHMFAPLLEVRMLKKCMPLWREAHFEVKMYKTPHGRATFGGSDVEKVHAIVARSTSRSQNAQNTAASDHFWKLRCRKSARRCGVKMYKTLGVRTTFGGSDVAPLQDTTLQNITLHYTPVHYITLHYTPVRSTTLNYTTPHYITLNDTATQIDR